MHRPDSESRLRRRRPSFGLISTATIFGAAVFATGLATATAAADKREAPAKSSVSPIDITIEASGLRPFRTSFDHALGGTTPISDTRAGVASILVRSTQISDRAGTIKLEYSDEAREAYGDALITLTLADLPAGVIPGSISLRAADGTAVGNIRSNSSGIYAMWVANDVFSRGNTVEVAYAMSAGATIIPQPAIGEPLLGLTSDELLRFEDGRVDYDTQLLEGEGLGPIFNKENCGNCHDNPVGGHGTQKVTNFGFVDKGEFDPLTQFGGPLLQAGGLSVDCIEDMPAAANIMGQRATPGMLGFGLVEAIEDADILANEAMGAGVSGRAHMVEALEAPGVARVGRFGWKAVLPTILSFSGDASRNEMGLTNRLVPTENDPNGINPPTIAECDTIADPEDFADVNGREFIDRVTDFQRFLAAPPQTPKSGMAGETIFNTIGCTECHIATFSTPDSPLLEDAIRDESVTAYSDFLLHDMGLAGDFIVSGDAQQGEVRTTPLMGLRVRNSMWHDGRFNAGTFESRVTDAINEHGVFGSEAMASANAYAALSSTDKDAVVAFLDSLGKREFDDDGDGAVDILDFIAFAHTCLGSTGVTADDDCAVHDVDQDGDVDINDFAVFLIAYDDVIADCNSNGTPDFEEIIANLALDADMNGELDDCTPDCLGDIDNSGAVDFTDLVGVIAAWGPCGGCAADLNNSGAVDFADLVILLAAFGDCS